MTKLEARIRRRLRVPLTVRVFVDNECVFEDGDVVKLRQVRDGVRLWTCWWGKHQDDQVMEWWFPPTDEVRVER